MKWNSYCQLFEYKTRDVIWYFMIICYELKVNKVILIRLMSYTTLLKVCLLFRDKAWKIVNCATYACRNLYQLMSFPILLVQNFQFRMYLIPRPDFGLSLGLCFSFVSPVDTIYQSFCLKSSLKQVSLPLQLLVFYSTDHCFLHIHFAVLPSLLPTCYIIITLDSSQIPFLSSLQSPHLSPSHLELSFNL